MTSEQFSSDFQKLQEKYLSTFPDKIQTLDNLFKAQDRKGLAELFHKLKGNGKTFGFPAVTEIARLVDLHNKKNSPDYFQWAELGIRLFRTIYPMMKNRENPNIENLLDFQKLRNSLPTV